MTAPEVLHDSIIYWFDDHARDLPWRRATATPWAVMVSEFMLQQTPVARVQPVYEAWMERWPTPGDLAAESTGEAVRAWGRLGYPRRALRLHAAATAIVDEHRGEVPCDHAELLRLPGVGEYTAAAIASFAFGQRHRVLDTNIRRVYARLVKGEEFPATTVTAAERAQADALLPDDPSTAATWAVSVMELGAVLCRAARPLCESCPVRSECQWRALGYPAYDGPPRRGQTWAGTDRQCRGRILSVLREAEGEVAAPVIDAVWHDPEQRERCVASLRVDGLLVRTAQGSYRLP